MVGLEICFPLLLGLVKNGSLPLGRLLAALTDGPARVVGLPLPRLSEGARADAVLVDPNARFRIERATLHGKSSNTPFLGREVEGAIDATLIEGRVVYQREGAREAAREGSEAKEGTP